MGPFLLKIKFRQLVLDINMLIWRTGVIDQNSDKPKGN